MRFACTWSSAIIDEEYEIVVSDEEHAGHEIVNGLDLTAYRANVSEVYTGARNAFVQPKAAKTTSVAQLDLVPPSANPPTQDGNTTPSVQGPVQTATSSSLSQTSVAGTVSSVSYQNDSVAASVSNVQATDFHEGAGPFILSQSPFHQPTATHVYPGQTKNFFPYQPVSYAMPAQANNLLTGPGPISHAGYSMPPSQHYFLTNALISTVNWRTALSWTASEYFTTPPKQQWGSRSKRGSSCDWCPFKEDDPPNFFRTAKGLARV